MSNRKQNPNVTPADNNGADVPVDGGKKAKEKTSFFGKIIKIKDRIMNNKVGRGIVRGLELAGVAGIGFVSYKAGAKSVKPTTIYIREGVTEEEPAAEEPKTKEEEPAENEQE